MCKRIDGAGHKKKLCGYIAVYYPTHARANCNGYIYEHTLVMEEALGRPLAKDEVVHHINRDRTDNRIENLRLMSRSEHSALHCNMYWNEKRKESKQ